MGSSAILRRCISRSGSVGIFRYRTISAVDAAATDYSLYHLRNSRSSRESAANRMMSTATSGASAPWLMLPAAVDGSGNMAYTFHCLAKNEEFTYKSKIIGDDDIIENVRFVGSSHGWLALHNRRNNDLLLSNPITDRHIKLPPLPTPGVVDRVILSSSPEEKEKGGLAFITFDGKPAFCSPRRSNEWTFFGDQHEYEYDDLVYSSRHKRLLCITREYTILEGWDVGEGENHRQSPRLDWAIQHNKEINFCNWRFWWKARQEIKRQCEQLKYLVCAEQSEQLYLVVRHVNPLAGPYGSLVDKIVFSEYNGRHFIRTPYKTIDFDVYKVDWKRGEVTYMEDSLEGLAMFVGTNHSFAIRASMAPGLKPDSVYFTDENRLIEPTRMARTNYGGHDNAIFDYQNKDLSPCCSFYPIEYDQIRKILPLPLWFTPPNLDLL